MVIVIELYAIELYFVKLICLLRFYPRVKAEDESFHKSVFALIVLMITLTLLDVYVIKYFWLPNRTTSFGSQLPWFWWLPFWVMQLTLPLGVSLLLNNRVPLVSYILFATGVEDTLFHIIAWQSVPDIYQGIYLLGVLYSPPRETVLTTNSVGIVASVLCTYALRRGSKT